uniref:RNA helicase n=1 Tax=Trypanosoma congolense (strain IL3000) TaxID=1068625 RepID=G0UL30_TRYCI|nr:putative RNA helicase [Trypanosoma congolense IL3000]
MRWSLLLCCNARSSSSGCKGLIPTVCDYIYRSSSAREQLRQLTHDASVENALRHLGEFSRESSSDAQPPWLADLKEAPGDLERIDVILREFGAWYVARKAPQRVTMHEPWDWYPKARFMRRRFIFHHGPTNSGKTHAALEELVKAKSGVYCAPIKALASQVWKHVNARVPCDLLIGDERKFGGGAEHVSCTVEMTPIDYQVDVGVIDEVQMMGDRDRGWAWARAILGLPAREIHLCGEGRAIPLVRKLLHRTREANSLRLMSHERLVPLEVSPTLNGDLRLVENGDCLVCFSRRAIFTLKERLGRLPGVTPHYIYGSMPFSVREAQADAFNRGVRDAIQRGSVEKHVLVSTDAIAYGLNMSIERIIFTSMKKFDGKQMVALPPATMVQVAGRAGRFGVLRASALGRCTTLHADEFQALRDALGAPLPLVHKSGLLPTADILELYTEMVAREEAGKTSGGDGRGTFYERVKDFSGQCQLSDIFFPCDLSRSLLQVAKELDRVPGLSLSDRILFCYVPLNDRDKETFDLLRSFAQDHVDGGPVRLRIDEEFGKLSEQCEHLNSGVGDRRVHEMLSRMEGLYRHAEMYCWLAWRFGSTFTFLGEGLALKERLAAKMEQLLQKL